MTLTKESLQEQLKAAEDQLEQAKSVVYRCDGAIQAFKLMIEQIDAPESTVIPES